MKLGSQPATVAETFVIGSTDDNLRVEIAFHSACLQQTFRGFRSALQGEQFSFALRDMDDALRSEASYVSYLQEEHPSTAQKALKTTYYVCNQCGYLTRRRDFQVCKVCYHFRRQHEPVS